MKNWTKNSAQAGDLARDLSRARLRRIDGEVEPGGAFALAARRVLDRIAVATLALLGYETVQPKIHRRRQILPMSSGVNIPPNASAQITSRPQTAAFWPDRIIIGGNANDWIVNDVMVGNRSQFAQSGDVPGGMFSRDALQENTEGVIAFETVQTAMDFVILVTYVGTNKDGAPFVGAVMGTSEI